MKRKRKEPSGEMKGREGARSVSSSPTKSFEWEFGFGWFRHRSLLAAIILCVNEVKCTSVVLLYLLTYTEERKKK